MFASGSGGTQAGLLAGASLTGFRGEILGISISQPAEDMQRTVAGLATGIMDLLGQPRAFRPEEVHINSGFQGEGYAKVGGAERDSIICPI